LKILTRDTDYAIRAIAELAKVKEGLVNVDELARSTGVPRAFLRKILQTLTRKKVIVSVKGRNGGFRVMNRAGDINLELIKIFKAG
jgi:Rrf2 family protein